jgi:NAD(P)-dependent dehydrogenase (short-subunit alcohol dehydrogenase family)
MRSIRKTNFFRLSASAHPTTILPLQRAYTPPPAPMFQDQRKLDGKVALVTGGAGGIGSAVAKRFAEHGAHIVVADLREQDAQNVANNLATKSIGVGCDLAEPEQLEACFRQAVSTFGGVDILVNNAGIQIIEEFHKVTPEQLRKSFEFFSLILRDFHLFFQRNCFVSAVFSTFYA